MRGDDRIREVLARYIPASTTFYGNIVKTYESLERLKDPEGLPPARHHGLTPVVSPDQSTTQDLEQCLVEEDFDGYHHISDPETTVYLHVNRGNELATLVDHEGNITQVGGVLLPNNPVSYARSFGKIDKSMFGYEAHEKAPGARHCSALCASAEIPSAVFMTLSKTNEISVFYQGQMIFNSEGRLPYARTDLPASATLRAMDYMDMRPPEPALSTMAGRPRMPGEDYHRPPTPALALVE